MATLFPRNEVKGIPAKRGFYEGLPFFRRGRPLFLFNGGGIFLRASAHPPPLYHSTQPRARAPITQNARLQKDEPLRVYK